MNNGQQCYACGKPIIPPPQEVYTSDGWVQWVGPECFRRIQQGGKRGYKPPLGGARLYARRRHEDY